MSTYVQVVLPLVLADLLQDGQVLLLDAVVLRLLSVDRLLLLHLVVIEVFDVLLSGSVGGKDTRTRTITIDLEKPYIKTDSAANAVDPKSDQRNVNIKHLSHLFLLLFLRCNLIRWPDLLCGQKARRD